MFVCHTSSLRTASWPLVVLVQTSRRTSLLAGKVDADAEATAAAVGCRLLVVDESGSNKTTEGAKAMVLDAATVKKFCDVAGTPIPYQPKFGKQDTTMVTWALLFYGNVVPQMRNADAAFKRRPSLMEIATEFVSKTELDPANKLLVEADERFRNRTHLGAIGGGEGGGKGRLRRNAIKNGEKDSKSCQPPSPPSPSKARWCPNSSTGCAD